MKHVDSVDNIEDVHNNKFNVVGTKVELLGIYAMLCEKCNTINPQ